MGKNDEGRPPHRQVPFTTNIFKYEDRPLHYPLTNDLIDQTNIGGGGILRILLAIFPNNMSLLHKHKIKHTHTNYKITTAGIN